MTDIALTAAQIGLVDPARAVIGTYRAGGTITKGQAVAVSTTGVVNPADASTGGGYLIQFRGVALNAGGAGQAIDVVHEGQIYGFTVSSLNVGAVLYLSNTAGALADGAGDVSVICGVVDAVPDNSATKVTRITTAWHHVWA